MQLRRPLVPEQNLYELAQPVFDTLAARKIPYGVVGSVGLEPFLVAGSHTEGDTTIALPGLYKTNLRRPREPGDVDIELRSTDSDVLNAAEALRDKQVNRGHLEVDFSPLYPGETLRERSRHPLGWQALKVGVTDTFVEQDGSMIRAGSLFGTHIDPETMQPHTVVYGEREFSTYRPEMLLARYITRSMVGVPRRRNEPKVNKAMAKILQQNPESREWLMDKGAPGEAWLRLARSNMGVWTTRPAVIGNPEDHDQHIVLAPRPLEESIASEDFLYPEAREETLRLLLPITKFKIRDVIYPVEHSKTLDAVWSQFLMPYASALIHPNGDKKQPAASTEPRPSQPIRQAVKIGYTFTRQWLEKSRTGAVQLAPKVF